MENKKQIEKQKLMYLCINELRHMGKKNRDKNERMIMLASANFLEITIRKNMDMQDKIRDLLTLHPSKILEPQD